MPTAAKSGDTITFSLSGGHAVNVRISDSAGGSSRKAAGGHAQALLKCNQDTVLPKSEQEGNGAAKREAKHDADADGDERHSAKSDDDVEQGDVEKQLAPRTSSTQSASSKKASSRKKGASSMQVDAGAVAVDIEDDAVEADDANAELTAAMGSAAAEVVEGNVAAPATAASSSAAASPSPVHALAPAPSPCAAKAKSPIDRFMWIFEDQQADPPAEAAPAEAALAAEVAEAAPPAKKPKGASKAKPTAATWKALIGAADFDRLCLQVGSARFPLKGIQQEE